MIPPVFCGADGLLIPGSHFVSTLPAQAEQKRAGSLEKDLAAAVERSRELERTLAAQQQQQAAAAAAVPSPLESVYDEVSAT